MAGKILIYLSAFFTFTWGAALLVPTRSILRGFGEISADNRRIVAMEWITEGVALIFAGSSVLIVLGMYV